MPARRSYPRVSSASIAMRGSRSAVDGADSRWNPRGLDADEDTDAREPNHSTVQASNSTVVSRTAAGIPAHDADLAEPHHSPRHSPRRSLLGLDDTQSLRVDANGSTRRWVLLHPLSDLLPSILMQPLWGFDLSPLYNGAVVPDLRDHVAILADSPATATSATALAKQSLISAATAASGDAWSSPAAARRWTRRAGRALAAVYQEIKQ